MTYKLHTTPDSLGWTNLSERSSDGTTVTLDFRKCDGVDTIRVAVVNDRTGENFILYPELHNAKDVFDHPYAFAARALQAGRLDRIAS